MAFAYDRLRSACIRVAAVASIVASGSAAVGAQAAGIDPHALYEGRCAGCHEPHARDLAQQTLELRGNAAHLKGGGALVEFLAQHPRGGLPRAEAEALSAHLAAMLATQFLYQRKCTACHDRASVLARRELIERDGGLVGRYSGRDIAGFLEGHGRLEAREVPVILDMLRRQLTTQ